MTELMRRRRALTNAQYEIVQLKDVPNGSSIRFSVDSAEKWIKFFNDNTKQVALLIKNHLYIRKKMYDVSTYGDYEGSNVDVYLSTTYLNSLPEKIRSKLSDYTFTVKYATADGVHSKTLNRKILIPMQAWTNSNGSVYNALKIFHQAETGFLRARYSDDGSFENWWLADVHFSATKNFYIITPSGGVNTLTSSSSLGVRPVISILDSTKCMCINNMDYIILY